VGGAGVSKWEDMKTFSSLQVFENSRKKIERKD
jgi:hypothetical protein